MPESAVSAWDIRNPPPRTAVIAQPGPDPGDPRLKELRERYAQMQSPMTEHAHWRREFVEAELRTNRFRADNCYLWQLRSMGESARLKYYLYARYLAATGGDELLSTLGEDGAFGAIAFQYATAPTLSRDLLDSVGELLFLDRQWGLRDRTGFSVVDIGAGYGRMAHRMGQAMSGLERYYCLDAVPESTFVCDWYLRFRGIDRAASVPLDELGSLDGTSPELAIATHSLSEMPFRAVQAWIHWLAEHEVDSLLVVPNENNRLLSLEGPGVRGDCSPLLARFGYWLRVDEPVICDPDIRALTGVYERFLLFERAR